MFIQSEDVFIQSEDVCVQSENVFALSENMCRTAVLTHMYFALVHFKVY